MYVVLVCMLNVLMHGYVTYAHVTHVRNLLLLRTRGVLIFGGLELRLARSTVSLGRQVKSVLRGDRFRRLDAADVVLYKGGSANPGLQSSLCVL